MSVLDKQNVVLPLFLFFLMAASGLAQQSAIDGIQANFKKQAACWNSSDLDCYMLAYAPNEMIQTISRGGVTKGHSAILENYKTAFPPERMGKLHFDRFEYRRINNKYYYVVGRFNLQFPDRDAPYMGYFSVLMKKIKGEWYIVSDHSS